MKRLAPRRSLVKQVPVVALGDPEAIRPVMRGETYPAFAAGVMLAFAALLVCYSRGYLLLYGDAVAHLAIARRIVDAHYPGLAQMGGVWLPLPHLLIVPFIRSMQLWQTGLAAAPMSTLSFAISVAGMWRLSRRMMRVRWALVATAFYALNANLLFLATTAMTEALFLMLFVWSIVVTMEGISALRENRTAAAKGRMVLAGLLVAGMVFTRYDGWIVGAVLWCCFAWTLWKSSKETRDSVKVAFGIFTVLCVAGPLLWFWYNAHFEGDWLDFLRGPYSAKQIERKTAPPGQHYRGWHNMGWALLFYTRTAQIDAAFWETGFGLMLASLYGLWLSLRNTTTDLLDRSKQELSTRISLKYGLLLWVPLPFYIYSVAYGSVPIFIPQLWPHAYYNARYGMEMLPAFAIYGSLAAERLDIWIRIHSEGWWKVAARVWQPFAMLLCVANFVGMAIHIPLVLKEGQVNATTRVAFEKAITFALQQMPPDEPVMMALSAHVGAVQESGRTLVSMVSENDSMTWDPALKDPAHSASFVIAIAGDPVDQAVKEHPEGLKELEVLCTSGQPCARVYQSEVWNLSPAKGANIPAK
ncbi:hypothetical protein [Granulicella paludicola]|uniref:hypothetical protein n=1 Tax=Granulicella paludicola TaxID=474951 RepID=UPI0021DF42F6|nr:hypothetical protein [Granulicella paludicola]